LAQSKLNLVKFIYLAIAISDERIMYNWLNTFSS
jgi:hypothetical protein